VPWKHILVKYDSFMVAFPRVETFRIDKTQSNASHSKFTYV